MILLDTNVAIAFLMAMKRCLKEYRQRLVELP